MDSRERPGAYVEYFSAFAVLRGIFYTQLRGEEIRWHHDEANPRLVCYDRPGEQETIRIYLNCTEKDIPIQAEPLFTQGFENGILRKNGILICKKG